MSVYCYDQPVCGPGKYFGREILVRSLVEGIDRGRSFVLLGGPKTGRTSTLLHVERLFRERWTRQPDAPKVVPIIYDAREAEEAGPKKFLSDIWRSMTETICSPAVFGQQAPVRPPKESINAINSSGDPFLAFKEACADLWGLLRRTPGWCRYALFIDGGDVLVSTRLEDVHDSLAAMIDDDEPWSPLSVSISCGRLLRESIWDHHSPLHGMRPLLLGVMRDSEAEALIRVGFPEAEEDWIRAMLATSGKHPYVLQRMLAEYEVRGSDLSLEEVGAAVDADTQGLMQEIWRRFDLDRGVTYRGVYAAPEHALMQYILDFGTDVDLKTAERELGIKPLKEYAEFLELTGVIERVIVQDSTFYRPQCDAWNIWYRQRIVQ